MRPPPRDSLYPYRRAWLAGQSRYKLGVRARQTGRTSSCAREALDDCIHAELEGRRARWIVLATSEDQEKKMFEVAVPHARTTRPMLCLDET